MDTPLTTFSRISIQGFRRLRDVKMELRPLSVMIGANGTGKTSVLDVLSLLASSAQGKLASSLSDLSGLPSVLTQGSAEELGFQISMGGAGNGQLDYALSLRPNGHSYEIRNETLIQLTSNLQPFIHLSTHGNYHHPDDFMTPSPPRGFNRSETSLAQVPNFANITDNFRSRLASLTFYHVLNVDPRSPVRLPQAMGPATLPGKNGEDLVSCLFYLRETERDRFDAVEDSLRAAFPRFERLDFPPVAAGTLALAWRERGSAKPLYMHQLSEGTLRFLWLTTLLQSPGLTALTLLDEPEVSLHPQLLSLLADQLREASRRTQIVVATHSDTLLRFLEPSEVVVLDSTDDGMTTLKRADELDLDDWLKDYSLGELWLNGRLGARV